MVSGTGTPFDIVLGLDSLGVALDGSLLMVTHYLLASKLEARSLDCGTRGVAFLFRLPRFLLSFEVEEMVIAATNRADILNPSLLSPGRLDRKIEFPHPIEEERARIMQIHSRKMNVYPDVNFEELARLQMTSMGHN
ncbi:26S proteasome regulatory subunit 6A [Tanacetum coccineum]